MENNCLKDFPGYNNHHLFWERVSYDNSHEVIQQIRAAQYHQVIMLKKEHDVLHKNVDPLLINDVRVAFLLYKYEKPTKCPIKTLDNMIELCIYLAKVKTYLRQSQIDLLFSLSEQLTDQRKFITERTILII